VLRDVSGPLALVVRAHLLDLDLRRSRERLVVAREEERRRLRRDLHDGLGPTLAAMALQVDRGGALAARDPAAAQRLLAELARQIRSAVGSVRTITDDLRVPELDDLGLVGALQELAERFSTDELAVEVTLGDGDLVDVPAAAEAAVYRIAAEATTNAARHAGAGRCRITLGRTGDDVLLEITDDGRGIGDGAAGIGLGSMRDRAEQLGGTLTVRSLGGGGTTVAATIPVGAP
jgi:signal transduction histidine kinase